MHTVKSIRQFSRWLLLPLGIAVALPGTLAAAGEAARPNLLLIVTDDQGVWDLGSSGNPDIDTPHLDALAKSGVSFARYYAAPVCSPTRAGLMTGRYAFRTGIYNTRFGGDSLARSEVTVAELLKQAGYRTGLFGKWHLGRYHGYQPQQRGFDEFLGHYQGHIERYEYTDQFVHNGRPVESRGYVTELVTDAAIDFIDESKHRAPAAPFFCYLAYSAPHSPFQMDTSHAHQPKGDAMIEKYLKKGLPLMQARIYAMVERVDRNIGRLLAHLETSGLANDTVVFFMSDNGGVSKHWTGELRGFKAQVYEGGVRSPLFVRWPGEFPAGGMIKGQASPRGPVLHPGRARRRDDPRGSRDRRAEPRASAARRRGRAAPRLRLSLVEPDAADAGCQLGHQRSALQTSGRRRWDTGHGGREWLGLVRFGKRSR